MRLRNLVLAHPLVTIAILLGFLGVASAAVPAFKASEAPSFCSTCHEMRPYYAAWQTGAHRTVDCVACHVDPGTVNHVTHKAEAAKELWIHVAGDPKFPGGDTKLPDSRCLACHSDIATKVTAAGFAHSQHVKAAPCITCHRDVGHKVTLAALKSNDLLKAGADPAEATPSVQTTGSSESTSSLHVKIACTQCHDLNTSACSQCHQPKHQARGACQTCHRPGPEFVFAHPSSTDCASCHATPAKHMPGACASCHTPPTSFKTVDFDHATTAACSACHSAPRQHFIGTCSSCHTPAVPFKKTVFRHTSSACESCHNRPAGHRTGACATCHTRRGVSWAFTHPSSAACGSCHRPPHRSYPVACGACHTRAGRSWARVHPSSKACGSCHRAPARHYGASCASCHAAGRPFKSAVFRHLSGMNCASCHKSGHRSYPVSCASCHTRPGSSWAHVHPSSRSCASCHSAPSSHYGTSCASCHSPGRSWSSATFSHPRLQEHTYKSFACSKCHPTTYARAYCSCHPGGRPPEDD